MNKLFKFTLLILAINHCFIQLGIAQTDSMNYFLEKRKKDIEPFDSSKVKIDLESLGLDDLDNNKKDIKVEKSTIINNNELKSTKTNTSSELLGNSPEIPSRPVINPNLKDENKNIIPKQNIVKTKEENKVNTSAKQSIPSKEKDTILPENKLTSTVKKNRYKAINENKKRKLSNRLKQEKSRAKYAKKQNINNRENLQAKEIDDLKNDENNNLNKKENPKDIQKKIRTKNEILNELRRIYLGDERDEKIQRLQQIDDDFIDNEIILPKPKDLSKFSIDELPAFPILSPYRNEDNFHIPFILTPKQKISMLFDAVKDGDVLRFIEIFKEVQNPNVQNQFGDTILTNAILSKKYSIMAEILVKGADPDLPNRLGYSPLEIAIEVLDFTALKILIDNRANINSTDRFGRSYLMHASRVGFLPAVDLLVKNGIEINAVDNDGFSALSIAYRHKKEVIVQYLIKNGAKQWIERKNIPEKQKLINELNNRWN